MLLRLGRPVTTLSFTAARLRSRRLESTWTHHSPSSTAAREVPTPLILLSASRWSRERKAEESLSAFVKHFTFRGWSVSCLDLDPLDLPTKDSQEILSAFDKELCSQIATLQASPFPPLMIAESLSTLIAEQYVSSNALSGLVLLNPPIKPESASSDNDSPARLPTLLPDFTYEATFPLLVGWSRARSKELAFWDAHRVEHLLEDEADAALERKVFDLEDESEEQAAGPNEVRRWAEDYGMMHDIRPEVAQEGADEETRDREDGETRELSGAKSTPTWFKEGSYLRNPTKSKKEPLLLDTSHILESFIRGSGPGGQAINKLSTCVQLKHVPTGIVVRCQETRSRELNRELARRKLSKELEKIVFGERESVIGEKAQRERRKKMAKARKRQRKLSSSENQ
ncbi:hypothetical protein CBS101457_004376 [Exobasidium rhododendri]|nr:hypothetical protein CBS101457_004376 [Exobasidium rhododendri]